MADGSSNKRKLPTWKKLLFSAIPLVVVLALLEVAARLAEPAALREGSVTGAPVRMPPKIEGSTRIVILGESTMEGSPLPAVGIAEQFRFCLTQQFPGRLFDVQNLSLAGEASTEILRKVRESMNAQPDVLVLFCGHNEFLRPAPDDRALLFAGLSRHVAMFRVPRYYYLQFQYRRQFEEMQRRKLDIPQYNRGGILYRKKLEIYERNMREIVSIARGNDVAVIVMTPPSNVRDWPPVPTKQPDDESNATYLDALEEFRNLASTGDPEEAEREFIRWNSVYPDDASFLYWRGRAQLRAGNIPEAEKSLTRARDLDPIIYRAPTVMLEFLRQLARENDLVLVDSERLLAEAAVDGIVGFDEVVDNCHPDPDSCSLIAGELVEGLASAAITDQGASCDGGAFLAWSGFLDPATGMARDYWFESGLYCYRRPFRMGELSRRYFERALEQDAKDWRIRANLASIDLATGDVPRAAEELARAVELKGGPIDLDDMKNNPFLKDAITDSQADFTFHAAGESYRVVSSPVPAIVSGK